MSTEVWPGGMPQVGDTAERRRTVTSEDIEHFTALSGDHNPITELVTTVTRQDGVVSVAGTAVCFTVPLRPGA